MSVTEEQLAEWSRLAEEAIDGPWLCHGMGYVLTNAIVCDDGQRAAVCSIDAAGDLERLERCGHPGLDGRRFDATEAFIAAARSAVPLLIERVRELEQQRDALETELADMKNEAAWQSEQR